MTVVTICGAGNTGHLYAGLMSSYPGVEARILSRRATAISDGLSSGGIACRLPDGSTVEGRPSVVSADPSAVIPGSDVVILTVPAHLRGQTLRDIAPHLPSDRRTYVGAIPGFCGFDRLAESIVGSCDGAVIWGMKDVPYMAYKPVPGVSSVMGGPKGELFVALHAKHGEADREAALRHLQPLVPAPVRLLPNYLEITLTPGNPIMHPAVLYALIGPFSQWDGRPFPRRIHWWSEATELGSYFMSRCDEEMSHLRAALQAEGVDVSSVRDIHTEIVAAYGDQIADPRTLWTTLVTNGAYADAMIPMVPEGAGFVVDTASRAFLEDVPFGLSLLGELGRQLRVDTPVMSEIEAWALGAMAPEHRALPWSSTEGLDLRSLRANRPAP